jgi:hypothetical protein
MRASSGYWARDAVDSACVKAEEWLRQLKAFEPRVNLGSVVGFKYPALLSEQDCVMHFSRFLAAEGVPWSAMHHQVSVSKWLFSEPHSAALAGSYRWRVDLALAKEERLLGAALPSADDGFCFDALVEFAYLHDAWTLDGAVKYGEPRDGREKVLRDIEKVGAYLRTGACRSGFVIVFADVDFGFDEEVLREAEVDTGCRVRFIRGYELAVDSV